MIARTALVALLLLAALISLATRADAALSLAQRHRSAEPAVVQEAKVDRTSCRDMMVVYALPLRGQRSVPSEVLKELREIHRQ